MTHLDLFSGIGGFAIAAQACGYTTIGFCEREPYAQQILKERFGAVLADADSQRGCVRQVYGEDASDAWESSRLRQRQNAGQLESTVCGMADGLPEGLDSGGGFCQWPEEDHETPRVITGMKHRAHRLKGLGNSIVPQVAEEIIRAIANLR